MSNILKDKLRTIIQEFDDIETRGKALEFLNSKEIPVNRKPSALAGAILYVNKTNKNITQKSICMFLRGLPYNYVVTEMTIRNIAGELQNVPTTNPS